MIQFFRRCCWPIVLLLLVSACGATPTATIPPTPTSAPAASPTMVGEPITVPPTNTSAPTVAQPTATGAPTVAQPTATSASPTATSAPTAAPPTATTVPAIASELLFLRNGDLIALALEAGTERILAETVSDFAATPDGRRIALVRDSDSGAELWVIERDGSGLRQLTTNKRAELDPSWAPDGTALVYTSSAGPARTLDWAGWSAWCAEAEVRLITLDSAAEQTLGAGCDPAFAPDGQRIAFATAPTAQPPGLSFLGSTNAIRLVNRAGANGWDYATGGPDTQPMGSYLVYSPAWAPDTSELAYQRFVGYQALVDINLTELGVAFRGPGAPIGIGAGWLMPPRFAPDGRTLAVVQHNFGDPRGFSGYDIWGVSLLRLGTTETVPLPSGDITLNATVAATLPHATAAAWAPDGASLAVILPMGWTPGRSPQEPAFPDTSPGAVALWTPGSDPAPPLADDVDFGSPLLWLPGVGA